MQHMFKGAYLFNVEKELVSMWEEGVKDSAIKSLSIQNLKFMKK
jgi:hypothetical protein